jgi:hypothetical protein
VVHHRRAQALIEAVAFLPVLILLVGALAYSWIGFSRQAAYASTANTLAEWVGRTGVMTAAMSSTMLSDLEANFGIGAGDVALYIRVSDESGAQVCSLGSAPDNPEDGVMPASLGWSSRVGTPQPSPTSLGLPAGYQVSVTLWGYSGLPFTASGSYLAQGHAVAYAEDNGFSGAPTCT